MKITRFLIVALLSLSAAHAELVLPEGTAIDAGSLAPESYTYKINGKWIRSGIFTTTDTSTKYNYFGLNGDSSKADENIYLGDHTNINDTTGLQLTVGAGEAIYNKVNLASTQNTYIYSGNFEASEFIIHDSKLDNATANLTIYGGSFQKIAGFFTNTGTGLTQNVNIEMYGGTVAKEVWSGIYGGNAANEVNGGTFDTKGSINIKLGAVNGQTAEVTFVAGGSRYGLNHTGDIAVTIENGARTWGAIGGNIHVDDSKNSTSIVTGNTNVTINGGIIDNNDIGTLSQSSFTASGVIGGGVNGGSVTGTSTVNILGDSVIKGSVIGASLGAETSSVTKSVINISGGSIDASGQVTYATALLDPISYQNGIYGGGVAIITTEAVSWNKTQYNQSSITTGSTEINISGGDITGNIYGGGNAQGFSKSGFHAGSASASSIVTGDTNITIGSNDQLISIAGDIYGGGNRGTDHQNLTTSTVKGNSHISLVGKGENLNITGTIYGGGANGATVEGQKILSFGTTEQTFSGSFDNVVSGFTSIVVETGSDVTWENYKGAGGASIDSKGSLTLIISDDLTVGHTISGTLSGDYTIYGGTYSNGVITVNEMEILNVNDTPNETITITSNASYKLAHIDNQSVTLDFHQGSSATQFNGVHQQDNIGALTQIANGDIVAYDFDITLGEDSSVLVTLALGDATFEKGFSIWHLEDGAQWENVTDLLEGIVYDDANNTISFLATDFSSYAITAYSEAEVAPEPTTASLSLIALTSLLMRRRRRQQQA